jgi:aminopeptidase YwaD
VYTSAAGMMVQQAEFSVFTAAATLFWLVGGFRVKTLANVLVVLLALPAFAGEFLAPKAYQVIRANASGERPIGDFRRLAQFSGYAPSAGADGIANYLAAQAKEFGMANVVIERFPSDGRQYIWAFRSEPYWEARRAELWLEKPERTLLASFAAHRVYLARLSRNTNVSAELVDVGTGTRPEEYVGKDVSGKIVLASGPLSPVLRQAIWERKALGAVLYRTMDAADYPDLVGIQEPKPWEGPHGEQTTFAFSLSNRSGEELRRRLATGEHLLVHAEVEADSGKGEYPVVRAEIPGSDPGLPAVLVYAHTNNRNSGGGNNLTGVGCTLEVARVLSHLVASGQLPHPRRTVRFMWGPEHFGIISHFHQEPDDAKRILAMINVDMIGYDQQRTKAVFHLFRAPYSHPSFLDDVVQEFVEAMSEENTISIRHADILGPHPSEGFLDPTFAPLGSRTDYRTSIEKFWGPSDHEDAGEASIGIPAILLNDFPDVFLGTQEDTPQAADATQMRRGVAVAASAAYTIASAEADEGIAFVQNAMSKAKRRLAEDELRSYQVLSDPGGARDAATFLTLDYTREIQALGSLSELFGRDFTDKLIQQATASLEKEQALAVERLAAYAHSTPQPPPAAHLQDANLVPTRNINIRGPVNFYRPEYGRWWLTEKTGDEHFDRNLALARRGHYVMYEALNFVDGKRTVAQIRDLVSDEFTPIPLNEFADYFKFLDSVGVVHIAGGK